MDGEDFSKHVPLDGITQALKNFTKRTDFDILDGIEIKRATAGLEGFLSLVLRVKVPFRYHEDETRHTAVLIVKCMPTNEIQSEIAKTTKVFSREGLYFDKIVPLLKKVSDGKVDLPFPTCYHSVYGGDNDVIFMEDIAPKGYKTPDTRYHYDGLEYEHCSLAMKSYGELHALTVAAERLLPEGKRTWLEAFPELKRDTIFYVQEPGEPPAAFKVTMEQGIETALGLAKMMDGLPKEAEASGKLRAVLKKSWQFMCKAVQEDPNGRNVLGHGDCWMNNIMYTSEHLGDGTKKPVGLKFIDFQCARYSSPCIDLMDFLHMNTRKSFRNENMDKLISIYYNSFVDTLNILGIDSPPFTEDQLRSDFYEVYMAFGLYYQILLCPIMILGEEITPARAEEMTSEKLKDLMTTGNSAAIHKRFVTDPGYRSLVEGYITDFVNAAFPNGLNSPESPMFTV